MPKVVKPSIGHSQPILVEFLNPGNRPNLSMSYNSHRYMTYIDEENDQELKPWILAQAGFYLRDIDYIDCCGCPSPMHRPQLLDNIRAQPNPAAIQAWHKEIFKHCRYQIDNRPDICDVVREGYRLDQLIKKKCLNPALWQGVKLYDLASAGFYPSDNNMLTDKVICFCCKAELEGWNPKDVPDDEHQRISPDCPYLREKIRGNLQVEGNVPIGTDDFVSPLNDAAGQMKEPNDIAGTDCAYEEYGDLGLRKSSFPSTWPHAGPLATPAMAAAGFFYVDNLQENGDRVACFKCGIALESWNEQDDPLCVHTSYSPGCIYGIF